MNGDQMWDECLAIAQRIHNSRHAAQGPDQEASKIEKLARQAIAFRDSANAVIANLEERLEIAERTIALLQGELDARKETIYRLTKGLEDGHVAVSKDAGATKEERLDG